MWTKDVREGVSRVYAGSLIGMVLPGVFSRQLCRQLEDSVQTLDKTPIGPGSTPFLRSMMLAPSYRHPKGIDLDEYFSFAESSNPVLSFVRSALEAGFLRTIGSRSVSLLETPSEHCIGSLRYFFAGQEVPWHYDTYTESATFEHLFRMTDRCVQLSWYIAIQNPENGGLLRVEQKHRDGSRASAGEAVEVPLEVGDMVLFDASNHRHQVTSIQGRNPRITFGGFAALDPTHKHLYYWG